MEENLQKDINQYIESQMSCKVLSSKPETTITNLGYEITIWNVKTDKEGSWWVANGGGFPMHYYPQDQPYYFSTDEVFSFHIGLMMRLIESHETKPQHVIDFLSGEVDTAKIIRRKLELTAEKLNSTTEIEEIQSIGVMCREILLKQIEITSEPDFLNLEGIEKIKKADFKNRVELILKTILIGKRNKELRKTTKNLAFGVWDLSNSITHSNSSTIHEAQVCLTLCTSFITTLEHLLLNYFDVLSNEKCRMCGSKNLSFAENGENNLILVICNLCNHAYPKLSGDKCTKCGSNKLSIEIIEDKNTILVTCEDCNYEYSKDI